jgi:wobble nucleotide-excising tRNase
MKSIRIPVTASFKNDVTITNLEKFNLFFGYNGSGKTTISRVLNRDPKAFVYNEDFVESNFRSSNRQKGIFTIGKDVGDAKEIIDNATKSKQELEKEIDSLQGNTEKGINGLQKEKSNSLNDNWTNIVKQLWKIKTSTDDHKILNCLEGYRNDKLKLANSFVNYFTNERRSPIAKDKLDKFRNQIFEKANILFDNNLEIRKYLRLPKVDQINIVVNESLWSKKIIGNKDNNLFKLIDQLQNSDWVNQGREFLNDKEVCPFCQEPLKKQFLIDIKDYFNEKFEQDNKQIKDLKEKFNSKDVILSMQLLLSDDFAADTQLEKKISEFEQLLDSNLSIITKKISKPSTSYKLNSIRESYLEIATIVGLINKKILRYNTQIKEITKSQTKLKNDFWDYYTSFYDKEISDYLNQKSKLEKEINTIKEQIITLNKKISTENEIIAKNQGRLTNLQTSINSINSSLIRNGFTSFKIQKVGDDSCCIVRSSKDIDQHVYKTLSEGEKTIISFLYFIEYCKGTIDISKEISNDRIVVIDDPISSLSHNIVFEISQIIRLEFLTKSGQSKYNQLFVLTHNLYLYYEIRGNIDSIERRQNADSEIILKLYNTYKVKLDSNGSSIVQESKRDEVLTDYDVYWSIVKDCKHSNGYKALLPNAMRNILEYYFGFIKDEDCLNNALENVTNKEFVRFIQRNSHSDKENFTYNIEEINVDNFLDSFEDIFIKTRQQKHYNLKMKV